MSDVRADLDKAIASHEKTAAEKRKAIAMRKAKADSSVLMGKAGAMGESIRAFKKRDDKAASQAYDHVQNIDESMAEDAEKNADMLAARRRKK